jgi:hypothetical protein
MPRQCAKPDFMLAEMHPFQFRQLADVNQKAWRGKPHVQPGQQTLPAGKRYCFSFMRAE